MFRKIVAAVTGCALVVLSPSTGATPPKPDEQRGCSHDGGLSGGCCGNNHLGCTDGTCSPSCGC
jgi:hypothetical protein